MQSKTILRGPVYPVVSISHLIRKYPDDLGPYTKRRRVDDEETDFKYVVDGRSVEAQRIITELTVREYFGAPHYQLSSVNLCPRISNRLCYLKTVEECLIEGAEVAQLVFEGHTSEKRWILDIGTGASLVYPILSTTTHGQNHIIASECNPTSFAYAEQRVLPYVTSKDRINLLKVTNNCSVFPGEAIASMLHYKEPLLYSICNPPFYTDLQDLERRRTAKMTAQQDRLKATDSELFYGKGGEVGFVKAYITQSQEAAKNYACFRDTWFTSQLGILEDVEEIRRFCRPLVRVFVLPIPLSTRRWIVAWNFNTNMSACTLADRTQKPSILVMLGKLDKKMKELAHNHKLFKYEIVETQSGNIYLAVNEALWLRKVRRSMKLTETTRFNKRIVLLLNPSQNRKLFPSVTINNTEFDLTTIANGLASFLGLL